jgi:hypothetical protein
MLFAFMAYPDELFGPIANSREAVPQQFGTGVFAPPNAKDQLRGKVARPLRMQGA